MQNMAINWHIYHITGSKVMLGLIGLARLVPIVIFSLIGGVVADARDRRRVMFMTQTAMLVSAALLAVLSGLGLAGSASILLLTAVTAAASAFDNPARQSMLPTLVPPEHLTNAVSLNTLTFNVATMAGPALGGFVIDAMSVDAVYWFNAVSFVAVIIGLTMMKLERGTEENRGEIGWGALLDGLKFVRSNSIISSTMVLDFFATFFSSATALLPVFAKEILKVGPSGLGVLYSAESVGAVLAGAGMSLVPEVRKKGKVLLISVAIYGLATALYGFSTNFLLSVLLLGMVGMGDSVSTVLRQTIRQRVTPNHIRGRMTSVNMMFFMGGPQLGNLEAGLVAAWIGAPLAVATGGIATIGFVALTAWRWPALRRYGLGKGE